jgi:hypothetical protein
MLLKSFDDDITPFKKKIVVSLRQKSEQPLFSTGIYLKNDMHL